MVDSDSKFANAGHNNGGLSSSSSSSIPRDPSFSGWCDPNQLHVRRNLLKNAKSNLERENQELEEEEEAGEGDFELPFVAQNQNQNQNQNQPVILFGQRLKKMDDKSSSNLRGNDNNMRIRDDNYVPLNVDEKSKGQLKPNSNSKSEVSTANVVKTLCFILVWYTFSLFLTIYNKSLLGDHMGKFPAPFLMNTIHFAMQASVSKAITWICWGRSREQDSMSWGDYFSKVVPTALATALDINLSNISLVFISVTFATMCKSASPIFLLVFAFAFRLEAPSLKLFGIIVVISIGVLLTVAKETEFEIWGFLFIMLAAVMSGFRWCMTQILLQKEAYGLENPIVFMSSLTPVMAIATAVLSLMLDPWHKLPRNHYFNSSWHVMETFLLMLFGGSLAFFMVLTEFVLISITSAVTVTIAGIVKEAVTIVAAVLYFHDDFTWLKGIGLVTIMVGVSLFNWYKYQKLQEGQAAEVTGEGSAGTKVPGKYAILKETDDQDNED